jgi:hypothetical protein
VFDIATQQITKDPQKILGEVAQKEQRINEFVGKVINSKLTAE